MARLIWLTVRLISIRTPVSPCGACIGECPVEAIEREEIVREVKNKEGKDLWVNVELEDGEPVGVVYELLGVGAELAAKADQNAALF